VTVGQLDCFFLLGEGLSLTTVQVTPIASETTHTMKTAMPSTPKTFSTTDVG
jgi:hypothetical protein